MEILITGHMGFIGSRLFAKLDATGLDIKEGNDIMDCDLPDADVVIHLAARPGVLQSFADPEETARINILGTIRLIERYKNARFIFASSGGEVQEIITSPYGMSKFCAEEYIKMMCKDYVILRFSNVYGEGNSRSVVDKFVKGEACVIYGDGSASRTFVYLDDIVRGIIDSLKWPTGLYSFGTEQHYTVLQLAEATKKPIIFADARKGERHDSGSKNVTPGWQPTIDVLDYIHERT